MRRRLSRPRGRGPGAAVVTFVAGLAVAGISMTPATAATTTAATTTALTTITTTTMAPTTSAPITTGSTTTPPATTGTTGTVTSSTDCNIPTTAMYTPGQTIAEYGFEDGTTQGWTGSTGVTLAADPEAARTGSYGLRVSGLGTDGYVSVVLPTRRTGTYDLEFSVRLAAGAEQKVAVQLSGTYTGSTDFGYTSATSTAFGTFTAQFVPGTVIAEYICNGQWRSYYGPFPTTVRLSYVPAACGDGSPGDLFVDDVRATYVASTTSTTTGSTSTVGTCDLTPTPTPTPTVTPTPTTTDPGSSCRVSYRVLGAWPGGFQAGVDVTNLSGAALTGWDLAWSYPGGERITQLWSATYTQDGAEVSVGPPGWAPTLAAGGTASFGFLAAPGPSGAPTAPSDFSLGSVPCSIG